MKIKNLLLGAVAMLACGSVQAAPTTYKAIFEATDFTPLYTSPSATPLPQNEVNGWVTFTYDADTQNAGSKYAVDAVSLLINGKSYEASEVRFQYGVNIYNGSDSLVITAGPNQYQQTIGTDIFYLNIYGFLTGISSPYYPNSSSYSIQTSSPQEWANRFDSVSVSWSKEVIASSEVIDPPEVTDPSAVPEPSTWVSLIVGFGLVGAAARRRKTVLA